MLQLNQQSLLLDALKPPVGMELDAAIGTTFTLDLAALLSIPVAQSFDRDNDSEDSADLLELIRRYADRTVLFCQAGAISIPPQYRAALTFVEQTVLEVRKPEGGLFHPKLWLVRFKRGDAHVHRAIILSRNLTLDRAWDVIVRLDEHSDDSGISADPLRDFITWLPTQTARDINERQRAIVQSLMQSLRGVRFEVPEPFTSGEILPLRRGQSGMPFDDKCDHSLAISPFLSGEPAAQFLATGAKWKGIVSRRAALDASASSLQEVQDVMRIREVLLDADEDLNSDQEDAGQTPDGTKVQPLRTEASLRGLHAKIYLQDYKDKTSIWLGSPNLTKAAFTSNVEMLVRLDGPKRAVGYDQFLQRKQKGSVWDILEEHEFSTKSSDADDEEASVLEHHACDIASRAITLTLTGPDEERTASLTIDTTGLPAEVGISASLFTLRNDTRVVTDGRASWEKLGAKHLTPFVLLHLSLAEGKTSILVRANLIGDSENRRGDVMPGAISDRESFMRYLAALLGLPVTGFAEGDGNGEQWTGRGFGTSLRLERILEDLLTTASRNPERLGTLQQTLRALEANEATMDVIPPRFRDLWDAVYSSRKAAIR
ncbi:hypothetical protein IEE94_13590 [Yimella sp. cx-573]|nr:hypothetical protein [Yimella sp. cx-573]